MKNIWFTSDTHYGHGNIVGPTISKWKSGYRDFKSLEQMNSIIVDNINSMVEYDDCLIHLGDWSFGGLSNIYQFRERLNVREIHLVLGNHDKDISKRRKELLDSHIFDSIQSILEIDYNKQRFFLSHYSHRIWNGSHRGVIHLYGHSHGSLPGFGKSMDVGVDTNNMFPYSADNIIKLMDSKEIKEVDIHKQNDKNT